jgi:hypothetical protein
VATIRHEFMAPVATIPRQVPVRQGFYRHLLLVCVLAILALQLPGSLARLSWLVLLYLTLLLGLRLGSGAVALLPNLNHRARLSSRLYRVLAVISACGQLIWLANPGSLTPLLLPLLILFILWLGWSLLRLIRMLSLERRVNGAMVAGATAGYLLIGIGGGLLLTLLELLLPGGFRDTLSGQAVSLPPLLELGVRDGRWDLAFGRITYFAFVCLTTVGFGDITPITPLTRLASLALSVLGPLYIAVVLGVLISRFSGGAEPPPWAPQEPGS